MIKYQIKPETFAKLAELHFYNLTQRIKQGRVIRRKYAASTIKKRKKYGLPTSSVRLYGSSGYSGKSWRLLENWKTVIQGDKVVIIWKTQNAARLAEYHIRRYGNIFKV